MIEVIVGIHYKANGKAGNLFDLRQQALRRLWTFKSIDYQNAVASHHETGVASCLAAVCSYGSINAVGNLFDREVGRISAKSKGRNNNQDRCQNYYSCP